MRRGGTIPAGLRAGDRVYRLPEGASAMAAPILRPLPGGGGRLLVGLLGASAVPAWILPGAAQPAAAWVLVPETEGALLLGGDALAESPPGAPLAPAPAYPPARLRLSQPEEVPGPSLPAEATARGGFRLSLPGPVSAALDLPFGALSRLLPMPLLHPAPDAPPDAPPEALGLAWTPVGPVLVLDPRPFGGDAGEAPLLAVMLSAGRQLGLPCRGATPITAAPALPVALARPALLAAAPLARVPEPSREVPRRHVLLASAGAASFALPLEEVAAVLPPQVPRNAGGAPVAGIVAHRGDVLPVLDAGARLGQGPVLGRGQPLPLLRLTGPSPVALAVSAVAGLRAVPEADIAPLAGEGLVAAVLHLGGKPIPLLRARALAEALARGRAA